jgi:hypothetical protein
LIWDEIKGEVVWCPTLGEVKKFSYQCGQKKLLGTQMTHFLSCVENGSKPVVSVDDGVSTLQLVECAKLSNEIRGLVRI